VRERATAERLKARPGRLPVNKLAATVGMGTMPRMLGIAAILLAASTGPATHTPATLQTATLGGGCFWCLEAFYERIDGIEDVTSGYSGGKVPNPSYEQVSTHTTGHAEVVQLRFDPAKISYREILQIFFTMHDPTTLNRQGADEGTQYRSIILYRDAAQKAEAERLIRELTAEKVYSAPIVTQVVPFEAFYKAEISHQDYYARNPDAGYCRAVISPKLAKLRHSFAERLKPEYR